MTESLTIRQSDLSGFSYCAMRQHYERSMIGNRLGHKLPRLSATIYGSVLHECLESMQRAVVAGEQDALVSAQKKFTHLWRPENITEVPGVEGWPNVWVQKKNSGMYAAAAALSLQGAYDWMLDQVELKEILLATEQQFDVPLLLDGTWHWAHGTIDRLSLTLGSGKSKPPVLHIKDWKTGKKPEYLQYAMQWTFYSWASTQKEFWAPFLEVPGFSDLLDALYARGFSLYGETDLPMVPRRGAWLSAQNGSFSESDCGFRSDAHFQRMFLTVRNYIHAQQGGFTPLTTDTQKCNFCVFNGNHEVLKDDPDVPTCGDVPLPVFQHGIEEFEKWQKK